MFDLGYIGACTHDAITSDAGYFTPTQNYAVILVTSSRKAHIKIVQDNSSPADNTDFQIQPDTAYRVELQQGDLLSFIAADGETDGDIWIAQTS